MKKTPSLIMIALMIASVMLYIAPEELNADTAQADADAAGDEIKLHVNLSKVLHGRFLEKLGTRLTLEPTYRLSLSLRMTERTTSWT